MELEKIPPEVFVNSVIYAAHKQYGHKRKNVFRWKAMKLVFEVTKEVNYPNLSFGCYKYGWYSFQTDSILRDIFSTKSLHGGKFGSGLIDKDMVDLVYPIIEKLGSIFSKRGYKPFLIWAHEEKIPEQYRPLYKYNDQLLKHLKKLSDNPSKSVIPKYYDLISEIVSELDPNLNHISKEYLDTYFDYIDELEGVLLVCKRRNFNAKQVKSLLKDFESFYEKEISSFIFPFVETLTTDEGKEYEIEVYSTNIKRKAAAISGKLEEIKQKISEYELNPTIDDFDFEIQSEVKKLDPIQRKDFSIFLSELGNHVVN
jgi:hypothetical protein